MECHRDSCADDIVSDARAYLGCNVFSWTVHCADDILLGVVDGVIWDGGRRQREVEGPHCTEAFVVRDGIVDVWA